MVAGFRRSIYLSGPGSKARLKEKFYHVRSTSLPSRSHPVITHIEDEIAALRTWQSKPYSGSPAWLCAGLAHLELLHASLDDLLRLPKSHDSLRRRPTLTERLLDDFLNLTDAYNTFRSVVVDVKKQQSETQIAIRRRDEARLVSCIKSGRRVETELAKLASSLRDTTRSPAWMLGFGSDAVEVEMAGILREVAAVTVSPSTSVFLGVMAVVASSCSSCSTSLRASSVMKPLRKLSSTKKRLFKDEDEKGEIWRARAVESLEAMEEYIRTLESRSERVFKTLVNTRVALLNILTPSL